VDQKPESRTNWGCLVVLCIVLLAIGIAFWYGFFKPILAGPVP